LRQSLGINKLSVVMNLTLATKILTLLLIASAAPALALQWEPRVRFSLISGLNSEQSSSLDSFGLSEAILKLMHESEQDPTIHLSLELNAMTGTRFDSRAGEIYRKKPDNTLLEDLQLRYRHSKQLAFNIGILSQLYYSPKGHVLEHSLKNPPPSHLQSAWIEYQPVEGQLLRLHSLAGDQDRVQLKEGLQGTTPQQQDAHTGIGVGGSHSWNQDKSLSWFYSFLRSRDESQSNERQFAQLVTIYNGLLLDSYYELEKWVGTVDERRQHWGLELSYSYFVLPKHELVAGVFTARSQFTAEQAYQNRGLDFAWRHPFTPMLEVYSGLQWEHRESLDNKSINTFGTRKQNERYLVQIQYGY
jgi:hypothetical protein